MLEMLSRRVHVIGDERAAAADIGRARRQHEIVYCKLAAATEQVAERALALGSFEGIGFVDPDPGQLPALGAETVELVRQGTFLGKQRLAGVKPLYARNNWMVHARSPLVIGELLWTFLVAGRE